MGRDRVMLGGAALLFALVLGYAVFSLVETERKVLGAAAAEGRALLHAVSAGVQRSLESSRALERVLADRLLDIGREVGERIAAEPGSEDRLLRRCVARHGLRGALLLDHEFAVVARGGLPAPSPGRLGPLVEQDLVRRVRERGLGEKEEAVVGFGENPFGTRVEFLVACRIPATGGYLLLRQDADRLRGMREEAGVERLLAEAAESPAIDHLLLQASDGTVLAASDPGRVGEKPPPASPGGAFEGGVLDVSIPVGFPGSAAATLRVGLAAEPVRDVLTRARRGVVLFSTIALVFGAGGIVVLFLVERSRRRREAERARAAREREQVASMGRLAAGVAHEIRSPLNAIGMAAQRLSRAFREGTPDPETVEGIIRAVREEVGRLNRTVEEFLDLGRPRALELAEVDVAALVREVVAAECPEAGVEAAEGGATVTADREELRKALANLVRNARQAAAGAPVVVGVRDLGDALAIDVRDGGPGVPEADRQRVFDHFYTGRPGGTGLGLAIARSAALRHGGRLEISDAAEGGACFTVTMPRRGPA